MDSEEDVPGTPLMDENDSDVNPADHSGDEQQFNGRSSNANSSDAEAMSDKSYECDNGPASPDAQDELSNQISDAGSNKSPSTPVSDAEDNSGSDNKMEIDCESGNEGASDTEQHKNDSEAEEENESQSDHDDNRSGGQSSDNEDYAERNEHGVESVKDEQSDVESVKDEQSDVESVKGEQSDAESVKGEQSDAESVKGEQSDAESVKGEQSEAESGEHSDVASPKGEQSNADSGESDVESDKHDSDSESDKNQSDSESGKNDGSEQSGVESEQSDIESEKNDHDDSVSENEVDKNVSKKKRNALIDSSDNEDGAAIPSSPVGSPRADDKDDDDDSDKDSNVGELIADIFGESDNDEDFEGFDDEDDVPKSKKRLKKKISQVSDSDAEEPSKSDEEEQKSDNEVQEEDEIVEEPHPKASEKTAESSDDDDDIRDRNRQDFVSDFEVMMFKKKEEKQTRRKRGGHDDIINDNDDLIAELIAKMKQSADEDCELNRRRMAATKKLKLLPLVLSQVRKQDLMVAFLDQGILGAFTDWLSPLPDKSLPHNQIRESLLKLLSEFPPIDQQLLKSSGIGRATMYLFKHPRESKINRDRSGRLINEWSRPIFNVTANFRAISKEEREQRDFEHMPKKRKMSMEDDEKIPSKRQDIDKALTGEGKALKPGDKGWIGRARVPLPSKKDYVVRPEWNVEGDISSKDSSKKRVSRLEKHVRAFAERKRQGKTERAVKISIEGNKMAL